MQSDTPDLDHVIPTAVLVRIPITTIDEADLSFVVSSGFDLKPLTFSIQALGLLNPPLVRRRPDGQCQIVTGWQRFLVLQGLNRQEIPVFLVPPETPSQWCLLASLQDNALGRGFNPLEAALMISRLLDFFPEDIVLKDHLPLLGLPSSRSVLQKYQALPLLEEPWQGLLAKGRLSVEAGARLSSWLAPDRQALLPWFRTLTLSHSKQLELLEYFTTLSRRTGTSPASWLAKTALQKILQNPILTPPEKDRQLWETLRQWCFPRLTQARQVVQTNLQALGLWQHPQIRLQPAAALEDSAWRLELRFQDPTQLGRQLTQLQKLLDRPELAALCQL